VGAIHFTIILRVRLRLALWILDYQREHWVRLIYYVVIRVIVLVVIVYSLWGFCYRWLKMGFWEFSEYGVGRGVLRTRGV